MYFMARFSPIDEHPPRHDKYGIAHYGNLLPAQLIPIINGCGKEDVINPIVAQSEFDVSLNSQSDFSRSFVFVIRNTYEVEIQSVRRNLASFLITAKPNCN
jgi:hypothetical protein